ncbi:DUF302 domain-containing protein [Flavobacteriaceae bacterium 3-367]|uniref:DUF302 domain-containing protein n=1 Tax=Eudoraea algarum TaxID=3417568 RepID=UPI00327EEB14
MLMDNNGLITKTSRLDFEATYNKLKTGIDTNPNLGIILELDHAKNAASVGLNLNPTRIIMFGNPNLGTLLMQNSQAVSIDLPQKIIVFQDDKAEVKVAYNDPMYLRDRHNIEHNEKVLDKISMVLDNLTTAATTD